MSFDDLGKKMCDINRDFKKYSEEKLKKYNVTTTSWKYLIIIRNKKTTNLNDIVKELSVDKAMVTRVVKKLQELQYIEKEHDSKDNRSYRLYLTDKGEKVTTELEDIFEVWFKSITKNFTDEECKLMQCFINRAHENLAYI